MDVIILILSGLAIFGIIAALVFRYLERKENVHR